MLSDLLHKSSARAEFLASGIPKHKEPTFSLLKDSGHHYGLVCSVPAVYSFPKSKLCIPTVIGR